MKTLAKLALGCALLTPFVADISVVGATTPTTEEAEMQALLDNDQPQATRPREPAVIAASDKRAYRNGEDLIINLPGKPPITFHSNRDCPDGDITEDNCVEYIFVADLPSKNAMIIEKALYESNDFVAIDTRTGRRVVLGLPPQFAPGGQRFLAVGFTQADENDPYPLELWERTEKGATMLWKLPYGDPALGYVASARIVKWDGENIVMEFDPSDSSKDTKVPKWTGTIRKSGNTWKLEKN